MLSHYVLICDYQTEKYYVWWKTDYDINDDCYQSSTVIVIHEN